MMTPMSRTIQYSREDILAAAMKVIIQSGLAGLTLDAVAKEAKISKGGVLYRYKSKDELLSDLVAFTVDSFFSKINTFATEDPEPVGRWVRGFLKAAVSPIVSNDVSNQSDLERLYSALFAAIAANPKLMQPHRWHTDWEEKIASDGVDLVEHYITILARDGLCFWKMSGMQPPEGLMEPILKRLEERTRPPKSPVVPPVKKPKKIQKKTSSKPTNKQGKKK